MFFDRSYWIVNRKVLRFLAQTVGIQCPKKSLQKGVTIFGKNYGITIQYLKNTTASQY
jgi:hypothetical protein